ncbi:MAG TPA: CHAT domain-containing tetratricopeptide repeat protein, partial [Myxococcaceae bacterium]|nr:CHAT domain-containing tetratricopeptide repeat protein [Myxococcaceae bacterium]
TTLTLLAELYNAKGAFRRAQALCERGLAIREAALGKDHPDVAASLTVLASILHRQDSFAQAQAFHERALAIREAAFGKNHPDVASSLNALAGLHHSQGSYDQAEKLAQRALAIFETAHGANHPKVAVALRSLASIYVTRGAFGRAEPLALRALAIDEAAGGKDSVSVATTLDLLKGIYGWQGLYGRALEVELRAIAIREAAFGKNSHIVAQSLGSLGELYRTMGFYDLAEPVIQRALTIREATHGKEHSSISYLLDNLAMIYVEQGLYDRAEPLLQRAIAIDEAILGKSNPYVAELLNDLADLWLRQGSYERAEPLLQRVIAIRETAIHGHPELALSLSHLGNLYKAQGAYGRAEPLLRRAIAINEAALGANHPAVAASLVNLADLWMVQGLFQRAEPLLQRALGISETAPDASHPWLTRALNDLAVIRLARGRRAEALPLLSRAFTLSEARLRKEALAFSGSRLESFLQLLRADEERLYALLRAHPEDAGVRRLALTAALLLKGRSVEETADTSRSVYRGLGTQDRELFERLRGLRTQLAKLAWNGPGQEDPATYPHRLKELTDQGDALERDLAQRSAPLRALGALPSPEVMVDRVAAALPKDGALVELIAYADRPLAPRPGTPKSKVPSEHRYLALVLLPTGDTRAVDLGPAAPIDTAASRLRDALASRDAAYQGAARELYRVAFRPLRPLLGNVNRLFLAPDGQLGLVPYAAFSDGHRFLADAFDFTYLTSGKDLLPRAEDLPRASSIIVLADPDFGTAPAARSSSRSEGPALAERSYPVERFFSTLRVGVANQPWVPLPGTRQEAEALQRLLPQAQLFLGSEATKARLLQLRTPGILHIATHGFFLEDAAVPAGSRAAVALGPLGGGGPAQRLPDPMLRSGLVLAGARAPATKAGNSPERHLEGSLVTALELAGLDLWGTQLVTLSACDTGRGDVRPGQGVYGMRRALIVAGAETLVMSLWKVNDETTLTLMEGYYRNLLDGKGRVAALREAMLGLRAKQPHPHFWAPFIALGRDAPLRGLASPGP